MDRAIIRWSGCRCPRQTAQRPDLILGRDRAWLLAQGLPADGDAERSQRLQVTGERRQRGVGVPTASLHDLAARVRPVLKGYLRSRGQDELDLIDRRLGAHRVLAGMPSAWLGARHERPELLAVEEGLFHPARVSDDGNWLTLATDVYHPDVIDDAVDELIETMLARGGVWLCCATEHSAATSESRSPCEGHTVESTNTKIRILTRVAFGFHSAEALIALAMLSLGGYRPDIPGRR